MDVSPPNRILKERLRVIIEVSLFLPGWIHSAPLAFNTEKTSALSTMLLPMAEYNLFAIVIRFIMSLIFIIFGGMA